MRIRVEIRAGAKEVVYSFNYSTIEQVLDDYK
jgi:hypothetical protein